MHLTDRDKRRIFQALCTEVRRLDELRPVLAYQDNVEHAKVLRDLFARNLEHTKVLRDLFARNLNLDADWHHGARPVSVPAPRRMTVAARDLRPEDRIRGLARVHAVTQNWGVVYAHIDGQTAAVPFNHSDPVDIDREQA